MQYSRRNIDHSLDQLLGQLPAILLDGPKAVGKTTTAMQRAKTIKGLQKPADRRRAEVDGSWLLSGEKPILIDEWQKVPESWELLKERVDQDYSGGQFILTGSLPEKGTHSGAGRITSLRMRPLGFSERNLEKPQISFAQLLTGDAEISGESKFTVQGYAEEITRSGFFNIRGLEGNALRVALDGYIERIIDTDMQDLGFSIRRPATLRSWLVSYAAATATTASWEKIRDSANSGSVEPPAKSTVIPYRDALTRLRILDELEAWLPTKNQFARASAGSKHFLADPALAARALNLNQKQLFSSGLESGQYDKPLLGRLFEALATLSIRSLAESQFAKVMHFRDSKGFREIDMIIQRADGKVLAIETKLAETVDAKDLKHLNWLQHQIGGDLIDRVVIYSGKYAYRDDGVAVIPLSLIGP